jgi:hypothetical protein
VTSNKKIVWPEGKSFAFTVLDDTDLSGLHNVPPVYSFLKEQGFRTTKTVWPIQGHHTPLVGGTTCEDQEYLKWVHSLKNSGFEIALHNVTYHSSFREEIITGLNRFEELFGHSPESMANHNNCEDGMYWGDYRLTGFREFLYNLFTRYRNTEKYMGHVEKSPYFWGDLCKSKIKFMRNFVFPEINTLKTCPFMPYYDPLRPYVNYWFASSEGPNVKIFNDCISEENQDRLEEEGGACIMYTHFAYGFYENNALNSNFQSLMKRLSNKNAWFVPVSTLLNFLLKFKGHHEISMAERRNLEWKWLLHKIRVGTT